MTNVNEDVATEYCQRCQQDKLGIDMVYEDMCLDCWTNLIDEAMERDR